MQHTIGFLLISRPFQLLLVSLRSSTQILSTPHGLLSSQSQLQKFNVQVKGQQLEINALQRQLKQCEGNEINTGNPNLSVAEGWLIISDSLNHSSIVNGARGSGASVCIFQHNIPSELERVLRGKIADGQPRTHRPWKKIMVVVEGIYSMEGELCKLPEVVAICKKYKLFGFLNRSM